jgi:phosphopantothenoylcysteine decarboxylase/phosphopantothenate--cysteine ligase
VADFRPAHTSDQKTRREESSRLTLELEQIPDLVATLGKEKEAQGVFRVGFAAEGSDLAAKALEKMKRKGLHAIVANDISRKDIAFGSDHNEGVMLFADGSREELPRMTKREMADRILDLVVPRLSS